MTGQNCVEYAKRVYHQYLKKYIFFRSLVFLCKHLFSRSCKGGSATWKRRKEGEASLENLTVAVICDDMTWENLQGLCHLVYLRPDNWFSVLEEEKPDLFFCESAWQGLSSEGHCWENRIAHNVGIKFENRSVLKKILEYCRQAEIPSVFWNKEDPHSDDEWYRFTDTAYLFDHVCTTAEECVASYRAAGHESAHFLPFGISQRLFYPLEEAGEENTAVFFGSWYQKYPQRCEDTRRLLDMVLGLGMKLTIYDRCFDANEPERKFPEKYRPYIQSAIPYSEIRNELKKYRYVLNINTETGSKTMFARRVFEIMACGRLIISNESVGMKKLFPDSVWYLDEAFDMEKAGQYIAQNQAYVLECQTMEHHVSQLLKKIKIINAKEEREK